MSAVYERRARAALRGSGLRMPARRRSERKTDPS